jgi:hypothetical protein
MGNDRKIPVVYRYETDPINQSQEVFEELGNIEIYGKRRKLYCLKHDHWIHQDAVC